MVGEIPVATHVHGSNTLLENKGLGWLTWLTTLIPTRFGLPGLRILEFSLYHGMCTTLSKAWKGDKSCLLRPV